MRLPAGITRRRFAAAATGGAVVLAIPRLRAAPVDSITGSVVGRGSSDVWPFFIGLDQGYFAKRGVKPDIIGASSSAGAMQQLAAGSVNMTFTGGPVDALRAIDRGADVTLWRTGAETVPYSLLAQPSIKSFAALKGKRIIIGGKSDITHIYLDRMLIPNGVMRGQYDLIYAGATAARFAAMEAGGADATLLTPPYSFLAVSKGFTDLGLTYKYAGEFPFGVLTVNKDWGRSHRPQLAALQEGLVESINWFNTDANRAEASAILAKASGLAQPLALQTYDLLRKLNMFTARGVLRPKGLDVLLRILKDQGQIGGTPDATRFFDPALSILAS
jgi:NitT/TauT family transport system substrate-binding protein